VKRVKVTVSLFILLVLINSQLFVSVVFSSVIWSKTYERGGAQTASSVIKTTDGGFAFGSLSHFPETYLDVWFIKTDIDGNMQLNQTYSLPNNQGFRSLIETTDGDYVLTGQTFTE